ncbi:MAG: hypothetical protein GX442_08515 [Candidatus Riflebacteria bacterium]|nr:hypothetical protein [Candidatus Riflebacteria bacterium]
MKRTIGRRALVWILAFLCAVQPLVVEVVRAESTSAAQAVADEKTRFDETYQQIMDLKPIEIDWLTAKTLCLGDSLSGQDWGTYEAKIKEANKAIDQAKQQASQAKTTLDLEAIHAKTLATEQDGVKSDLTGTTKAKALLQTGLRDVGNQLKSLGEAMNTVSLVMSAAYIALVVIGAVATVGVLSALVTPLGTAATVLGIVGTSLSVAGQSLVNASQAGANTDNAVLTAIGCGVATGVVLGAFTKYAPGLDKLAAKGINPLAKWLTGKSVSQSGTLSGTLFNFIRSHSKAYDVLATRALNAAGRDVLGTAGQRSAFTIYDGVAVTAANQARQNLLKEGTTKAIGLMLGQMGIPDSVSDVMKGTIIGNLAPKPPEEGEGTPAGDPRIKTKPGLSIPKK